MPDLNDSIKGALLGEIQLLKRYSIRLQSTDAGYRG